MDERVRRRQWLVTVAWLLAAYPLLVVSEALGVGAAVLASSGHEPTRDGMIQGLTHDPLSMLTLASDVGVAIWLVFGFLAGAGFALLVSPPKKIAAFVGYSGPQLPTHVVLNGVLAFGIPGMCVVMVFISMAWAGMIG